MEELAVMRFGKVDLSLTSFDVFQPDFVLLVNASDGRRRYLLLTKSPVEQLRPLGEGQVGGLLQCRLGNQVPDLLLGELRSPHWIDLKAMTVRAHA